MIDLITQANVVMGRGLLTWRERRAALTAMQRGKVSRDVTQTHEIIESFQVEKTSKILKSNHQHCQVHH